MDLKNLTSFSFLKCELCAAGMDAIDWVFEQSWFTAFIEGTGSILCELSGWTGQRFKVCPSFISLYYESMLPVITDYIVTRERVCVEALEVCSTPVVHQIDLEKVVDDILATKPEIIKNDDFLDNLYAQIAADPNPRETLTAIHISDVHIDADYVEGSLANCSEYLCCRDYAGYPKRKGDIPAGKWGSGQCDLPIHTF
jgi:hypothetical protein